MHSLSIKQLYTHAKLYVPKTQRFSTRSPSLWLFTFNNMAALQCPQYHTVPMLVAAGLRHPIQIREFKHQDAIPESLKVQSSFFFILTLQAETAPIICSWGQISSFQKEFFPSFLSL